MDQRQIFNILNSVDSTNNYAMAKVHEGLATHGFAYFANTQTQGKGQRGKEWISESGKNILLSIVLKPSLILRNHPFYLSALIALCCLDFLEKITAQNFFIKWPNDLYWGDRKAGGILIENRFAGPEWKWAVVGIGINVNQTHFTKDTPRAVSIHEITGQDADAVQLALELYEYIIDTYDSMNEEKWTGLLIRYNQVLYKKNELVKLKKNAAQFLTTIKEVNKNGQLITQDVMKRKFDFGEVEWII